MIIWVILALQDDNLHQCSPSHDSEDSGSEESTDDGNADVKDNGYHDAENDVDPEVDDDPECVLSGKLNESSGYVGIDLYEYKVCFSWSIMLLTLLRFFCTTFIHFLRRLMFFKICYNISDVKLRSS